ncbi:MAG: transposase family protein [Planctomycetes bacterium]|nr:transposase family protein [Planctomycetota bacterium]
MSKLTEHYRLLLGLDAPWEVSEVSLSLEEKCVEIQLVHRGGAVTCPECEAACGIADHGPERTWRHLDTMQFETVLRARTPRTKCKTCGVKTTTVPWAGKQSRFTLMFEAFAIEGLQACGNVKNAATLLTDEQKGQARKLISPNRAREEASEQAPHPIESLPHGRGSAAHTLAAHSFCVLLQRV